MTQLDEELQALRGLYAELQVCRVPRRRPPAMAASCARAPGWPAHGRVVLGQRDYSEQEQTLVDLGAHVSASKLRLSDLETARKAAAREKGWIDDSAATECRGCQKVFNVTRRFVVAGPREARGVLTWLPHPKQEAPLPQLRRRVLQRVFRPADAATVVVQARARVRPLPARPVARAADAVTGDSVTGDCGGGYGPQTQYGGLAFFGIYRLASRYFVRVSNKAVPLSFRRRGMPPLSLFQRVVCATVDTRNPGPSWFPKPPRVSLSLGPFDQLSVSESSATAP